jgi:hypothetical protein
MCFVIMEFTGSSLLCISKKLLEYYANQTLTYLRTLLLMALALVLLL